MKISSHIRKELENPAAPGGRHNQMLKIAASLIRSRLSPEAVFTELRGKYDADVSDREIRDVITWVCNRNLQPSSYRPNYYRSNYYHKASSLSPAPVTKESAVANAERLLRGFSCDEVDLWETSPWRPLDDPALDALPLLAGFFHGTELVNLCPEYGVGITKTRDDWMRHIRDNGVPSGSIGCMFRLNPVSGTPTGDKGGWGDKDVMAYRFALVESDTLPLDLQLSIIVKLPLPIAAIIFSGGKSYHAIIRVDAVDAATYRGEVARMLQLLCRYGFDRSTGNPSRMSRLPGAMRDKNRQQLLYLNPDVKGETPIFGD